MEIKERARVIAGQEDIRAWAAQPNNTANIAEFVTDPAFSKWLCIWCFCYGYLSFSATQRAFAAHPEWRAA